MQIKLKAGCQVALRLIAILLISILNTACATYPVYTSKLDHDIPLPPLKIEKVAEFDKPSGLPYSASLGDEVFRLKRVIYGNEYVVSVSSPVGTSFPYKATWKATHAFYSPEEGQYLVYTTPNFYAGIIGVILDRDLKLVTNKPVVQLEQRRAGRRWGTATNQTFFSREKAVDKVWGLRYGGKRGNDFQFEVIDQTDPKEIEVVQELMITPDNFYTGFIVRGVLVKGLSESEHGVIRFQYDDLKSDF